MFFSWPLLWHTTEQLKDKQVYEKHAHIKQRLLEHKIVVVIVEKVVAQLLVKFPFALQHPE